MKLLDAISGFFGRFMALIVLALTILALFVPASCNWIATSCVTYFLAVAMFCMGLTLKFSDFT